MQLTGDPQGLAALQEMKETNRDYLKFLIQEARTVFEHAVDFKDKTGVVFVLHYSPKDGSMNVVRKTESNDTTTR